MYMWVGGASMLIFQIRTHLLSLATDTKDCKYLQFFALCFSLKTLILSCSDRSLIWEDIYSHPLDFSLACFIWRRQSLKFYF